MSVKVYFIGIPQYQHRLTAVNNNILECFHNFLCYDQVHLFLSGIKSFFRLSHKVLKSLRILATILFKILVEPFYIDIKIIQISG